jgi:putative resolvase
VARLRDWAERERSGKPTLTLTAIGSGLNTERKALVGLMELAQRDEVEEVVVTYTDRLTRFGVDYLTRFFAGYGVRLTADLLAMLSSFAGRLYGMRSRKRQAVLACAKQVLQGEE